MPANMYRPGATRMILRGEPLMIRDLLHRGLSITAIAS